MPFRKLEYKWIVAIVFVMGFFMDVLDATIVNVAVPQLAKHFSVGEGTIEWVVTGYLLSLAVWIPASGWIGDRFGTKRTFLFALFMFTAASALCGAAWSINSLIAFRVLQGVGGGMLTPVGTAMLFRAFPPQERAQASKVLMIPSVLAPALGPIIGGFLVTKTSWHWIFYVNLPIGAVALVVAALSLKEHTEPSAGRFDVPGFVLSGGGLALVLYALSQGPGRGWISAPVTGTLAVGLLLFAALVLVETRVAQPMLDLRLYRDRMFRTANIVALCSMGSLFGLLFLLPLYLQRLRGLTALQSGLTTFPQAFGVILMSQVAGRLYPKIGPRRLMAGGMSVVALSNAGFLLVGLHTSLWAIRGLMLCRGFGMSFTFLSMQAATFSTIRPSDTGRASSLYTTVRQTGAALGTALLATVLISATNHHMAAVVGGTAAERADAGMAGFHTAFVGAIVFSIVGALAALLVHDEDAAATLSPDRHRTPAPASADH